MHSEENKAPNTTRLLSYVLAREVSVEELTQVEGALRKAETNIGDTGDTCIPGIQS